MVLFHPGVEVFDVYDLVCLPLKLAIGSYGSANRVLLVRRP